MRKLFTLLSVVLFSASGAWAQSTTETWAVADIDVSDTTITKVNGDFSASGFTVSNPMVTFKGVSTPLPDYPYNITKKDDNRAADWNWAQKNTRTGKITNTYVDSVGVKPEAYWAVYDISSQKNQVIPGTKFFTRVEGQGNPYVKAPVVKSAITDFNGFHLYGHGGTGYQYSQTENPAGCKIPTDNGNPSGAVLEGSGKEVYFAWKNIPSSSRLFSSQEAADKYGTKDEVQLNADPAYSQFIYSPSNRQAPVQGCYYEFTPKYAGTMKVAIRLTKGEQVVSSSHKADVLDDNGQPTGETKDVADSYNYVHRPFYVIDKSTLAPLAPSNFTFVGYISHCESNPLTESDTEDSYLDSVVVNNKTTYVYANEPKKAIPYTFTMNDDYTFQPGGVADVGSAKAARYSKYFNPLIGTVAFPVEANKTYIMLTPASQIGLYGYEFTTSDPNAAASVNALTADTDNANAPRYNVAGQRVDGSYKGIVIQNGRKIVKK